MGIQDALFIKNILRSLGLKVKMSIFVSIDECRAVDIGIYWSVGGRKHHMEVIHNFLWELKEAGIMEV